MRINNVVRIKLYVLSKGLVLQGVEHPQLPSNERAQLLEEDALSFAGSGPQRMGSIEAM